jgi:copper chaperone CopZ
MIRTTSRALARACAGRKVLAPRLVPDQLASVMEHSLYEKGRTPAPGRGISVPNITCMHCSHTIRMELLDLNGVREIEVNVPARTVRTPTVERVRRKKVPGEAGAR